MNTVAMLAPIWRRRIDPADVQRTERLLGVGRLLLALTALAALWIEPTTGPWLSAARFALIGLYIAAALLALLSLEARPASASWLATPLHAIDIACAALLTLLTGGPQSTFLAFCAFSVFSAAYRWGLRATMVTAVLMVSLLIVEAALLPFLPLPQMSYQFDRLGLRLAAFMLVSVFAAVVAEREQRQRIESVTLARILEGARPELGVAAAVSAAIREIAAALNVPFAVAVVREVATGRAFLWSSSADADRMSELDRGEQARYLFELPADVDAWVAVRPAATGTGANRIRTLALDSRGRRLTGAVRIGSAPLDAGHPWRSHVGARIAAGDEWEGRVFLLDPALRPLSAQAATTLQTLCRRAAPAMYRIYAIRRLRARMRAVERTRFARELHENVVQGLVALQLQLETLRRRTLNAEPWIPETLDRLQEHVKQEVLGVRTLMEHLRAPAAAVPPAVPSSNLHLEHHG